MCSFCSKTMRMSVAVCVRLSSDEIQFKLWYLSPSQEDSTLQYFLQICNDVWDLVKEWFTYVAAVHILAAESRLHSSGTWCRTHENTASAANHCSVSLTAADDVSNISVGWGSMSDFTWDYALTSAPRLAAAGLSRRPVSFSDTCCSTLANGSGFVRTRAAEKLFDGWNMSVATCQHTVMNGRIVALNQVIIWQK